MSKRYRPVGRSLHGRGESTLVASVVPISVLVAIGAASPWSARANPQPESIQGVPQQIVPEVPEVGLGNFTIQTGTAVFSGSSGSGGSGSIGTGTGGEQTNSTSLDEMLTQPWGEAASANAQALGVNATALAATCQLETNCTNLNTATSKSSVTGAFQMTNATFQSMYAQALVDDPTLATTTTDNANDPASEAAAAAEYLKQGASYLSNGGVSNPTVLDGRAYYNFGPAGGLAVDTAPAAATMASVLTMYSSSQLAKNGITQGETVGQWQASVAAKLGNSASAPIMGN